MSGMLSTSREALIIRSDPTLAAYISIDGRTHVGFAPGGYLAVFRGRESMRVQSPVASPVDAEDLPGRRVVVGRQR